jgi:hypothetical protein
MRVTKKRLIVGLPGHGGEIWSRKDGAKTCDSVPGCRCHIWGMQLESWTITGFFRVSRGLHGDISPNLTHGA